MGIHNFPIIFLLLTLIDQTTLSCLWCGSVMYDPPGLLEFPVRTAWGLPSKFKQVLDSDKYGISVKSELCQRAGLMQRGGNDLTLLAPVYLCTLGPGASDGKNTKKENSALVHANNHLSIYFTVWPSAPLDCYPRPLDHLSSILFHCTARPLSHPPMFLARESNESQPHSIFICKIKTTFLDLNFTANMRLSP